MQEESDQTPVPEPSSQPEGDTSQPEPAVPSGPVDPSEPTAPPSEPVESSPENEEQ